MIHVFQYTDELALPVVQDELLSHLLLVQLQHKRTWHNKTNYQ